MIKNMLKSISNEIDFIFFGHFVLFFWTFRFDDYTIPPPIAPPITVPTTGTAVPTAAPTAGKDERRFRKH